MAAILSVDTGQRGSVQQGAWAPLTNVTLARTAMQRASTRGRGLHGVVVLYGPSGIGKTQAALYCQNRFGAVYLECCEIWSVKGLLCNIARELGMVPGRTATEVFDQVTDQLRRSSRPLILDQGDVVARKGHLRMLRDLYTRCGCTLMLIGEERLPALIDEAAPQFYSRVLEWVPGQLATLEDCRKLSDYYVPDLPIVDDLLEHIRKESGGIATHIRRMIEDVRKAATSDGLKRIDLAHWGERRLSPARAPKPRSFR